MCVILNPYTLCEHYIIHHIMALFVSLDLLSNHPIKQQARSDIITAKEEDEELFWTLLHVFNSTLCSSEMKPEWSCCLHYSGRRLLMADRSAWNTDKIKESAKIDVI